MRIIEQIGGLGDWASESDAKAFLESSPDDQRASIAAGYVPAGSLPADLKALVLSAMQRIAVGNTASVQYLRDVPDADQRSSVEAGYIPGTQLRIDGSSLTTAFVPGTSVRVRDIPSGVARVVATAAVPAQQVEAVATRGQAMTGKGVPSWAWVVGGVVVVGAAVWLGRK